MAVRLFGKCGSAPVYVPFLFFLLCLFAFVLTVRSEVCVMAAMGDCVKMPQTKNVQETASFPSCLPKSHQVPTILNALQRSVQAVLVGKIQIQDWFGNGIKRAALMNKWVLKEVTIDEDERCLLQTDGSFLYLLCKDGLYKVGSGYSGTVRVRSKSCISADSKSCISAWLQKTSKFFIFFKIPSLWKKIVWSNMVFLPTLLRL